MTAYVDCGCGMTKIHSIARCSACEMAFRVESTLDAVIAERDRLRAQLAAVTEERDLAKETLGRAVRALPPRPLCRDCADHDGMCQSDGKTPCGPAAALPLSIAALTAERDRLRDERATCNGSCDIALARRQVGPDVYVPFGNARECAEMWEREASRLRRLLIEAGGKP